MSTIVARLLDEYSIGETTRLPVVRRRSDIVRAGVEIYDPNTSGLTGHSHRGSFPAKFACSPPLLKFPVTQTQPHPRDRS